MAEPFFSGFVALLGRPNVGKSTLLNRLVGEKVSIVSPRPQTTRNRLLGVLHQPNRQVVFVDTPGLHRPRTRLAEYMDKTAREAMQGVDVLCLLVDATRVQPADLEIAQSLRQTKVTKFLLINKADLVRPPELLPIIDSFSSHGFDMLLPISARTGEGMEPLMQAISNALPEGPRYFPEDMWTDQNERQMVAEIVREKALMNLKEEVPHGIGVEVLSMEEKSAKLTEIHANIYCDREGHKRIIIGAKGSMLQKIGSQARESIELLLGTQVNLQLWVKVREGWRDNPLDLRTLGYTDK